MRGRETRGSPSAQPEPNFLPLRGKNHSAVPWGGCAESDPRVSFRS
jgi:hypothetical protein